MRTTDVTGAIGLPDGAEMVMPGDNVEMAVELITPIALENGQRFAIREGGRTVGAGAVTSIAGVGDDDGEGRERVRSSARVHRVPRAERTRPRKNKRNDPNRLELQQVLPARAASTLTARRSTAAIGRRGVAQLAEHRSPKPAVVGSSPIAPATSSPSARKVIESNAMCSVRRFLDESWSELKKVTWPTREQIRNLTDPRVRRQRSSSALFITRRSTSSSPRPSCSSSTA